RWCCRRWTVRRPSRGWRASCWCSGSTCCSGSWARPAVPGHGPAARCRRPCWPPSGWGPASWRRSGAAAGGPWGLGPLGASIVFLISLSWRQVPVTLVLLLLAGGLVAAPLAAWLVRRLAPRKLGGIVGAAILLTNFRAPSPQPRPARPPAPRAAAHAGAGRRLTAGQAGR